MMRRHIKIVVTFSDLDMSDTATVVYDSRRGGTTLDGMLRPCELSLIAPAIEQAGRDTFNLPRSREDMDRRIERAKERARPLSRGARSHVPFPQRGEPGLPRQARGCTLYLSMRRGTGSFGSIPSPEETPRTRRPTHGTRCTLTHVASAASASRRLRSGSAGSDSSHHPIRPPRTSGSVTPRPARTLAATRA